MTAGIGGLRQRPRARLTGLAVITLAVTAMMAGCGSSNAPSATLSAPNPLLPASGQAESPTPLPTPTPSPVPFPAYQAGINLLFYSNANYAEDLTRLMTRLHADHVNSVALTFPFYTGGLTANSVHTGSGTPPDAQLEGVIGMLEASQFSVMLRPLMDESNLHPASDPSGWRGAIAPASAAAWFQSYTALVAHYARIAASTGVQALDIGTELYSMESDTSGWTSLIGTVRALYPGKITYSVNGNSDYWYGYPTGWIKDLDFLSLDGYWNLQVGSNASVGTVAAAWAPFLRKTLAAAGGKPVILSEVGVAPQDGEQYHPWESPLPGPIDYAFQQRYYEAACQAASAATYAGIYWWQTNLGTPGTFDPIGHAAEQAIASCFSAVS